MERRIEENVDNLSMEHVRPHSHILAVFKAELQCLAQNTSADRAGVVVHQLGIMFHDAGLTFPGGDRVNGHHFRPFLKPSPPLQHPILPSSSLKTHSQNESAASAARQNTTVVRVPIQYAGAEIGELRLELPQPRNQDVKLESICVDAAKRLGLLAKRHQVHTWAARRFGMNTFFVGQSRRLFEIEAFVELASQSAHPVLISGEFGTEKALTAMALHALSEDPSSPFVEVQCAAHQFEDGGNRLAESIDAASGGTVFFNAIDEIPLRALHQLPELLASRFGQWLPRTKKKRPARMIASTTSNLRELVQTGRFPKTLLAEFDFLSVRLPPLRERLEDVPAILEHVLEKNGFLPQDKCSPELIAASKAHEWPENLFELERTVVKLAAMTGRLPITDADIDKYTPWLRGKPDAAKTPLSGVTLGSVATPAAAPCSVLNSPERWVDAVVSKDLSGLRILHPNLQKALTYLSENSSETISLGQLAKYAGVSPSHLAYLFKSSLGIPFKPFLGRVRIEKAKQRLVDQAPIRITEVAFDVGFMDLSHFEKLFKRLVGVNAREYRRRSISV